jgi:eukaryotic-like serine/threonine-protein kinase
MIALLSLFWVQGIFSPNSIPTKTVSAPGAFDLYLSGLDLIQRWDKDDNLDNAIKLFREASTLDPTFALAFARLADALRMRYALTRNEEWLDEASASAATAARLNANLAPVQVALGRVYAARGNVDLAFAALTLAVEIDPNNATANQAIASMYARLGRLEDAEASVQRAVALEPENLLILSSYANFQFTQSHFEQSAILWRAVVRLAPDHYAALVNLGSALNESGKIAEAITMYERAIEIRPTYMAYSNLGTSNGRAGRYPEAIAAFQKVLEIEDSDWLAWGNLGYAYSWKDGHSEKTTQTFERATELGEIARQNDPRDPLINSYLALYYAKLDNTEVALQRLATAISLAPDNGEVYAAAAETYEILGQRDNAIAAAKKSLQLGFPQQQFRRNPEFDELLQDPRTLALL